MSSEFDNQAAFQKCEDALKAGLGGLAIEDGAINEFRKQFRGDFSTRVTAGLWRSEEQRIVLLARTIGTLAAFAASTDPTRGAGPIRAVTLRDLRVATQYVADRCRLRIANLGLAHGDLCKACAHPMCPDPSSDGSNCAMSDCPKRGSSW